MVYFKKFKSGLRMIVVKNEQLFSVSCGIMAGVGSAYESEKLNGISHFIEHTTFKGTAKRDSFSISADSEYLGSRLNAYTAKEVTLYYIKSTTDKIDDSFEILSDIYVNSTYPEEELEREKGVVIEEINMSDDTPDELCLDLLSEAFFSDKGYGRTILGSKENVKNFKREDILKFREKYYTAENTVIVFAGNVNEKQAESLVERYVEGKLPTGNRILVPASDIKFGVKTVKKDIEQIHLGLAFRGEKLNVNTEELSVASTILGGGMSSRLFQRIREELGLCYTVYAYPSAYINTGSLVIYSGLNSGKIEKAYSEIMKILEKFKADGVGEKEFIGAKNQNLASNVMAQESTATLMMLYAKYLLVTGQVYDNESRIKAMENLSLDRVNNYIKNEMDFSKLAVSLVGKNVDASFIK